MGTLNIISLFLFERVVLPLGHKSDRFEEVVEGKRMKVKRTNLTVYFSVLFFLFSNLLFALEVGEKAPDFDLPNTQGGELKLSSFLGKKNVVIEFYVLYFTPT